MKKIYIITFVFLSLGCQKTDLLNPADQISKIDLQISGLNAPGDSVWYECWLMWTTGKGDSTKNVFESIGLLTNNNGNVYSKSVDVNPGYLQQMLHVVITMEEDTYPGYRIESTSTSVDTFKGPSSYRIIAAKIAANSGNFNIGNDIILDYEFGIAQATFILDTPTDTTNTNLNRGIWFINLDSTFSEIKDSTGTVVGMDTVVEIKNGLELPELPKGWFYEGWIIFGSDTVSTGKFIKPFGPDSSSNYGVPLASGYNFPGEDFINNPPAGITFPTDLSGLKIFITLEVPHPANSVSPFKLIPYVSTIPINSESQKVYSMENNAESFPSGNLSIIITLYE